MLSVTKPGGPIYVCHADSEGEAFRWAMREAGWLLKQTLVWVKQAFVMGRQDYHWQHEPILYGWAPGAAHPWHGDRKQSTVWEVDRPFRNDLHPTMKPVALVEKGILNSSAPGALLFEPFGGSGSTLIAAEQTGRTCYLMELSPKYCDRIVTRWEGFTGQKAIRL
ncbi:DNA adenine methyltransferase YhdJ [compost metagenome]